MGQMLFALVWVLNFAISIWNAYAVGKVWVEARVAGGWHRLMCWIGAIMSACGFTWCYLSFLALTAHYFQWLTDEQVLAALNLGYVLLLPFILFGGYAITLDSWAQAFRRGGLLNSEQRRGTPTPASTTPTPPGGTWAAPSPASATSSAAAGAGMVTAMAPTRSSSSFSWSPLPCWGGS